MSTRSTTAPGALDPETSMRARLKTLTTITAVLVAVTAIFVAGAPAAVRRQRRRPSLRATARRLVHELHHRALVAGAAAVFVVVGVLFHGAATPAAAARDEAAHAPAAPVLQLASASKTSVPAAASTPAPVVAPIVAAVPEAPVVKAFDPNDLIWPVHAPIWSPFGRRPGEFHTGDDLGAPYGTPIAAANSGTVIFAGWESGYGQETRIDHGGGIVTVYAHQSTLLVHTGQHVDQGQIIGKVGATGRVTAAHLHFEVRVNGTPQNPMRWLQNAG